jgi:hypothetical protein
MAQRFSLAVVLLFCMTLFVAGCGGGGGSASPVATMTDASSPEAAVERIFASWRADSGPVFNIDDAGRIAAQTNTSETRYIRMRDLSGNTWNLTFTGVEYISSILARVNTRYYYGGNPAFGGMTISFLMGLDAGVWYLEGIQVIELPAVVVEQFGIKGVLTDKITGIPVSGARVEAYNQATGVIAGYSVTDVTGFYGILDLPPATYYLVINRTGYEPYTISDIIVR